MVWESALGGAMEIGIAIAGFSGIVAVLGRRSLGEWTQVERCWLRTLLSSSFSAVLFAYLPFVLASAEVDPPAGWRLASAAHAIALTVGSLWRGKQLREADPTTSVSPVFVLLMMLALLQLVNATFLATAWPYLLAIAGELLAAFVQFFRLLMRAWE